MPTVIPDLVELIEQPLPDDPTVTVKAVRIQGSGRQLVVDTLFSPAAMSPWAPAADLVVYTHADWDHCLGTAAFPGVPVLGHRLTRERLLGAAAAAVFADLGGRYPDTFAGAAIVPPDITFERELTLALGDITVTLHHGPGHTTDSIFVHVPAARLIVAGDWAEDPLPAIDAPEHLEQWRDQLEFWADQDVGLVIPSHGRPQGPELLRSNAAYLAALLHTTATELRAGHSAAAVAEQLPVDRLVPRIEHLPDFYRRVHADNVATVFRWLARA